MLTQGGSTRQIDFRVTLQPFLWGPCRETHCATCCHLLTKWSRKVSPSPFVLDCCIRTSRQPFQLTSQLLLKEQKLYPARGKNSEQPMKTCFLRSPYIRCLLHLQKKEKSWIWAWSPRIFSLGTHQKWVNEYWPHLRARSWELKTVERLRLLSWEPSLESEQTPTLSRMVGQVSVYWPWHFWTGLQNCLVTCSSAQNHLFFLRY